MVEGFDAVHDVGDLHALDDVDFLHHHLELVAAFLILSVVEIRYLEFLDVVLEVHHLLNHEIAHHRLPLLNQLPDLRVESLLRQFPILFEQYVSHS